MSNKSNNNEEREVLVMVAKKLLPPILLMAAAAETVRLLSEWIDKSNGTNLSWLPAAACYAVGLVYITRKSTELLTQYMTPREFLTFIQIVRSKRVAWPMAGVAIGVSLTSMFMRGTAWASVGAAVTITMALAIVFLTMDN